MPSFFLAMMAVFVASIGAKDQLLVARLANRNGLRVGLLVTGCATATIAAGAMAWGGHTVAGLLPASGKTMLIGIALLVAALELFWPVQLREPEEPTHSLGAASIVLLARQIGDAGRFCVFALAAATGSPLLAGLGGALGGMAAIAIGWAASDTLTQRLPLRPIRMGFGASLLIAAIATGLTARGII